MRSFEDAPDDSALFRDIIEPLSDAFDPALCDVYAEGFAPIIERTIHCKTRRPRPARKFTGSASRVKAVFVLSRVTLGADVAITSVILAGAKQKFSDAEVVFVGPEKNFELFNADPRIRHLPIPYSRSGTLAERLQAGIRLRDLLDRPDAIVIDPDSRLTQLGLIPVCDDSRYYFFESRSYGADSLLPLSLLTSQWMQQIFGAPARPYIAPASAPVASGQDNACISLGVGNNSAKRVPDPFECELIKGITERGCPVLIDYGAGDDETQRVDRAIAGAGGGRERVQTWRGAFAVFAASIAQSRLYVGYDSSGQHVAAACGVPLVMVSAGAPNSRFQARWRPAGSGPIEVIYADSKDVSRIISETLTAIDRMLQLPARTAEPRWPAKRLIVRA